MRGQFGLQPRGIGRRVLETAVGVIGTAKFFWEKPRPIAAPRQESTAAGDPNVTDAPESQFVMQEIPPQEVGELRRRGAESQATLNDLLIRDLFLHIRRWNVEHGDHKRQRLRVMMPTNLRIRGDEVMPAANVLSFAFLTRPQRALESPQKLLDGIRQETAAIRKYRLGLYFVGGLAITQSVQRWLPMRLNRQQRCLATSLLTNLGDPVKRFAARFPRDQGRIVCGNLILDRLSSTPPLFPLTRAAITIQTYANRLTIGARCDPHYFTPADAREFLNGFVGQLNDTRTGVTGRTLL